MNYVAAGGPGVRANIRPGDVIAAVGGQPIHDGHDFVRESIAQPVGQPCRSRLSATESTTATSVTLSERHEAAGRADPGAAAGVSPTRASA